MTYSGPVRGGVVVFDGSDRPVEGAEVRIEVLSTTQLTSTTGGGTVGEGLARLAGAAKCLPSDLAERHDEYRRTKAS
jgi:hypothetical protein